MYIDFKQNPKLGSALLQWWEGLNVHQAPRRTRDDEKTTGSEETALHVRGDRAGRAVLRRADSVTAVVMTPTYQRLHRRLCAAGWQAREWPDDHLAAAIGLLAHVEVDDDQPLPRAMSCRSRGDSDPSTSDDRPPVSPLRFMRLLESPDVDALFTGLRRALPLLSQGGGIRADVRALATDVVNWGDGVKKRWAYAYDWPDKPGG